MADRDGEVRWDGLCSRDASARDSALENIKQAALKKSEAMALIKENTAPPAAEGLLPAADRARDGLNEILARLLMLSKRCPFRDVREKSEAILRSVQLFPYVQWRMGWCLRILTTGHPCMEVTLNRLKDAVNVTDQVFFLLWYLEDYWMG